VNLGTHAQTAGVVNFDGTRSALAMNFTSTYAVNVTGTYGDDSISSPGGTLHGMGGKDTFVGGASATEKYAYDNTGEVRGFISDGNGGESIVVKADQITQFGLGTGGLAPDMFSFLINQHPDINDPINFTSNGFIVGNEDTVINGFSKLSSVANAGGAEITVLTTVGVSDANVATTLAAIAAVLLYKSRNLPAGDQAALLVACSLFASPYALSYDMAALAPLAAAVLLRDRSWRSAGAALTFTGAFGPLSLIGGFLATRRTGLTTSPP